MTITKSFILSTNGIDTEVTVRAKLHKDNSIEIKAVMNESGDYIILPRNQFEAIKSRMGVK